jgi:arginase
MIHIFKLNSRLGLLNPPHRQEKENIGVENGSDAILSKDFLDSLSQMPEINEFDFPAPNQTSIVGYQADLAENLEDCALFIEEKMDSDQVQVCVGGDHIITFSSLLALTRRVDPSKIGYIQIDSHGDSNLFSSSPTSNFHGMFLRPFFADFDCERISKLITSQLKPEQIMFVGNLDLDEEEKQLFTEKNIAVIDQTMIQTSLEKTLQKIEQFKSTYEFLHISFDIDVFDASIAPGTGIPAKNGLLHQDVFPILKSLFTHKKVTLDLVEVNPSKDTNNRTVHLAQEILSFFISRHT